MIIMIDKKDRELINVLKENSRLKTSDIAKKVHMPRTTVYHRIKRLEEEEIIKKFTIVPDYSQLGRPITAFILVSFLPTMNVKQRQVAEEISTLEGVYEVHLISGEWDMLLKVRASSMEKIGELVIDRLREIKGVGKTVTCGCFSTVKEEGS
ncbi:MAG: Lrp/AsnC family transcriptional regulator [Theionarchaea archaeon]|nr:MAG: transcriptional regulator [Theionarchaea archaeon DG-70]MBU7009776.1 Lrp/AsnC family transcriptional regulator [Theionarchaea archaeon]